MSILVNNYLLRLTMPVFVIWSIAGLSQASQNMVPFGEHAAIIIFQQMYKDEDNYANNVVLAPSPVLEAILQLGIGTTAGSDWAQGVQKLFNAPRQDVTAIAKDFVQSFSVNMDTHNPGVIFKKKAGMWLATDIHPKETFSQKYKSVFGHDPQLLNFSNQQQVSTILNEWTVKNTNDKIKTMFGYPLPINTPFVTAGTLYFKAPWIHPFNTELTKNRAFTSGNRSISVPMMTADGDTGMKGIYANQSTYEVAMIPFADGFMFTAIKPKGSLDEAVHNLLNILADVHQLEHSEPLKPLNVEMPKFDGFVSIDLTTTLMHTCLRPIFYKQGDLDGIATNIGTAGDAISKIAFNINEKGGEVAAMAAIVGLRGINLEVTPTFKLNRASLVMIQNPDGFPELLVALRKPHSSESNTQ